MTAIADSTNRYCEEGKTTHSDSQTTVHMLKYMSLMTKIRRSLNNQMQTAGAGLIAARCQGESEMRLTNRKEAVQLDHVLHVPEIENNLLSVLGLCDADHTELFTKDKLVVKTGSELVCRKKLDEEMYCFELRNEGE